MTSNQTSSWQTERKQKDSALTQSAGKTQQDTGGMQRFIQLHTDRREIYQGAIEH